MKFGFLKSEDIWTNAFVADEDKIGDQVTATMTVDGTEITGRGDDKDTAAEDLRNRVNDHYAAAKYKANSEIDKALGINFFE